LHALFFDPSDGLIAALLDLESAGSLERVGGELRLLDVCRAAKSIAPEGTKVV
jgi:hypothetical protein